MMTSITAHRSRRAFMRQAATAAISGAGAPVALNLAALGSAAAATPGDYKALVCVFLLGANDNYNTVVPYDVGTYNQYAQLRGSLATPRSDLSATALTSTDSLPGGRAYALAPQLKQLHKIWTEQRLAVALNVGPLLAPTSKNDFQFGRVPLPPKLFSHNDQQSFWQSLAAEGATTGWGGRMTDLFAAGNQSQIFSSISMAGNAVLLSGQETLQYQMSFRGPVGLKAANGNVYGSRAVASALQQLIASEGTHELEKVYASVTRRSLAANDTLTNALASVPGFTTAWGTNSLSQQLQMVARLIAARNQLGMTRQVFFVAMPGFDTHDSLVTQHPKLLAELDAALSSFYRTTQELNVADQVTTFTASDFGRTITSNGDGSDHGWGGDYFVMGGAVAGQRFYGVAPELGNDGPDDVGRGRLLPTTSVDQLAATMGSWFGVSDTGLNDIFQNLSRFDQRNLGLFG